MVNVVILCALSLGLHGLTVNGDNSIEKRLSVSEEADPETTFLREKLEEEHDPLTNWGSTVKDKAISSLVIFGTPITTITVALVSYILVWAVGNKSMYICPAIFIILLWILLLSVVCLHVDDVFEYVIDEAFKKDIMVVAKYAVLPILSVSLVIFVSFTVGVLMSIKCNDCDACPHKKKCKNTSSVS